MCVAGGGGATIPALRGDTCAVHGASAHAEKVAIFTLYCRLVERYSGDVKVRRSHREDGSLRGRSAAQTCCSPCVCALKFLHCQECQSCRRHFKQVAAELTLEAVDTIHYNKITCM